MADIDDDKERRERAYRLVGELVDGIIAQACARHYFAPTQEHQFTSKIADRIEYELKDLQVFGMDLSVHAQDFPDKGRGSWEAKSGGGLNISIVVEAPREHINKGMMVQSKWDDTVGHSPKALDDQTEKMKARTRSSYVWVYGPSSIAVVPSEDVAMGKIDLSCAMTVGNLITEGMRCREGDPSIGRDLALPVPQSLTAVMEQLSAKHGLSIQLSEPVEEDG